MPGPLRDPSPGLRARLRQRFGTSDDDEANPPDPPDPPALAREADGVADESTHEAEEPADSPGP